LIPREPVENGAAHSSVVQIKRAKS
jgi:hypothetical protein